MLHQHPATEHKAGNSALHATHETKDSGMTDPVCGMTATGNAFPTADYGGRTMMHADFSGVNWSLHLTGFLLGGILWVLTAGVTAWLLAAIYNRLL